MKHKDTKTQKCSSTGDLNGLDVVRAINTRNLGEKGAL
jgi:hypothetical protein